jgi:hypothetical protein
VLGQLLDRVATITQDARLGVNKHARRCRHIGARLCGRRPAAPLPLNRAVAKTNEWIYEIDQVKKT